MTRSGGKIKRIVVKIGSALVTDGGRGLDHQAITQWAEQIAQLRFDRSEDDPPEKGNVGFLK